MERVLVPARIEPAAISHWLAIRLESYNYGEGCRLIRAGERERVERALRMAEALPDETERYRRMWAVPLGNLPMPRDMPADLLADWQGELGRLPHQIRGIRRALQDEKEAVA